MKKQLLISLLIMIGVVSKAQTILNENGDYELKVVEQYGSIKSSTLYEHSLVALSDVVGSLEKSKTNIDVADKDAGLIVFKGEMFLGCRKVNTSCGYEVYANLTLKVRCKDERVQYTLTVPSLTMYWTCDMTKYETIPLNEIIPEYIHKGRLHYLKKGAVEYSGVLDDEMKELQKEIAEKTKVAANDDDF